MKKTILFVLAFSLLCCATAQAQLMVEEGKVRLTVEPGRTVMKSLYVQNTSDKPVQVRVYWEDFIYIAPFNGEKDFFPAGNGKYTCASWVTVLPREFTLAPFAHQNIDYVIRVPADAKGGHYGVLFFENSTGPVSSKVGVNIVTRIGSLFFIETKNKNKNCQISDWKAGEKSFTAKFTNQGDVFLLPQGTYYIMDSAGMAVDRGDIPRAYLPPEGTAEFSIPILASIKSGDYQMIATFDLEDDVSTVAEVDFNKDANGKMTIQAVRN